MRTSLESRANALLDRLLQAADAVLAPLIGEDGIAEAKALLAELESDTVSPPDAAIDPLGVISYAEDVLIRIGREVLATSLTAARLTLLKQQHADALVWEAIDSRRARAEGWDISVEPKRGRYMLEILDEVPEGVAKLHTQELALGHLYEETVAGSDFHRRALRLLTARPPA